MATATKAAAPARSLEVVGGRGSETRSRIMKYVSLAILVLLALMTLYPFLYAIGTSFKSNAEAFASPLSLLPQAPTLEAYQMLNTGLANVPRWTLNSALVALIVTITRVLFDSIAGYALARMHFAGRNIVFVAMLGTMMIPGVVLLIPRFIVLKQFGMLDSYWGLTFPFMVDVFGIFMMKQFFESVPYELEEAAFVDGANRLDMFFRVVLPTAGPALAALAIFSFQGMWNNFMDVLVIVNSPDLYTLPLGLGLLRGSQGVNLPWNFIMAGSVLTTLPMALIFLFFQRYFVEGISYSGIKG